MGPASRRRVGLVPSAYHENPDIGAFELAVLCVLATHANRMGACWPSQGTIAAAIKLDRGTVNRVLTKLVELGLVEKSRHPNRRIRCWMYRLVGHEALMEDFLAGLDDGVNETKTPAPASAEFLPAAPLNSEASVVEDNTEHLEHSSEESLSLTREDAGVSQEEGQGEAVTIGAEWVPDAADMAFAKVRRPDLTPADVALIGAKFALHYAGRKLPSPTAIFHRWILTERVSDHDSYSRRHNSRPSSHQDTSRHIRPDIDRRSDDRIAGLTQRNSAAADECLRRILARRGEHFSA
jgi:DNA-binding MarR family transcriptional regulator